MNKITHPLNKGTQGPLVANLHIAMQMLLERGLILAADEATRNELAAALRPDIETQSFGEATGRVVDVFQRERNLQPSDGIDSPTAEALNTLLGELGVLDPKCSPAVDRQTIEGTILLEHGMPAEKLLLRLYKRGLYGKTTLLGEVTTDVAGHYAFSFDAGSRAASLEVRAVKPDGTEVPLTKPLNNLTVVSRMNVNILAPGSLQPLKAEYSRLSDALTPHVDTMSTLKNAREDAQQQDLSLLNRATGWDARLIALAAISERLAADQDVKESGLSSEALYGLLRIGLPSDKLLLAHVEPDVAEMAIKRVRDAGIVQIDNAAIEDFKTKFTNFANKTQLAMPVPGSRSTYDQMLDGSGAFANDASGKEAKEKFVRVFLSHRGSGAQLWEEAHKAGLSNEQIARLQLHGRLAFLTGNNEEMIKRLLEMKLKDPVELVGKGFYQADSWKQELFQAVSGSDIKLTSLTDNTRKELEKNIEPLIPATFAGKKVEARLDAYTEEMARKVRLSYPTQVLARIMDHTHGDDKFKLLADKASVQLLNESAANGFRLGHTPVEPYFRARMTEEEFKEAKPQIEQLKSLQRIYQITPCNEAMPVLQKMNITSAFDVMAYPEEQFIDHFKSTYEDIWGKGNSAPPNVAELISRKAKQVNNVTYNLFAIARKLDSEPLVSAISGMTVQQAEIKSASQRALKGHPTMESLFGSMDYCECEHCRSVLSPAAYLVDLLQFVDAEPAVWGNFLAHWKETHGHQEYPHKNEAGAGMKPYDVLVKRRPDLPHIALTCENTQTTLPYIDIVNEILEYYVANDNLTKEAVRDTGDATTTELLAEPQYVLPKAYCKLRSARYPLNLPFDLWLETVRKFCDNFETPLHRLLDVMRQDEDLVHRVAIFMESLGLSPNEVKILADSNSLNSWYELYGFKTEKDATKETTDAATGQRVDLNSAKALARRLGVTYKELADIVQTAFVNPELGKLKLLYRLDVSILDAKLYKDENAFYNENKDLLGKDPSASSVKDQQRFDDLSNKRYFRDITGWDVLHEVGAFEQRLQALAKECYPSLDDAQLMDKIEEFRSEIDKILFDKALVLADPNAGCNFDQTTLQYAGGNKADPIVFLRINLFVRLWRKLGWSIEETDRALTSFIPQNAPFNEDNLEKQPLETALIYLAHLKELDEKLNIGRQSRLQLITLWSDIATTGKNSLYAQLFLNRSVLKSSPVFDHPLGQYLTDPDIKLKDHLHALQGALGLTAEEISRILKDTDKSLDAAELSLGNISLLYRYGLLAKALKLSVHELIAFKELSGLDPFKTLHPDPLKTLDQDYPFCQTLKFIKVVEEVKDSGLRIEDLEFLLQHRIFDEVGKYRPNREGALALLRSLSEGVRAIRAEHAVPDDPAVLRAEVLQQKLGLVFPADVAAQIITMGNGTAEYNEEKICNFFARYLKKQSINDSITTGFFDDVDFDLLFKPTSENDGTKHWQAHLAQKILPFLQQRMIRQYVVQIMTVQTGADPLLAESMLTDKLLLAESDKPILDVLVAAGERGINAAFFDSQDCKGVSQPVTLLLSTADTALKDKKDKTGKDLTVNSACFEGYLQVPTPGAYRFFVELEKQNAETELVFPHRPKPVLVEDVASVGGATLGDKPYEYLELKAGVIYRFSLKLKNLNGGNARLLVQGETVPKGPLSQLTLYPAATIEAAERALTLLTKALQLVQSLGLSEREIRYMLTHASDFNELSLSELPTAKVSDTAEERNATAQRFAGFRRLAAYAKLKRTLAGGTDDLIAIFEANGAGCISKTYELIGKLTRREPATVEATAKSLKVSATPSFESEKPLWRLWEALQVVERFGVPPASLKHWTNIVSSNEEVQSPYKISCDVKEAIKARFEPETWQRVAQPIFDKLRQRQRDALVSYILQQMSSKTEPTGIDTQERLYDYFLIDPGMEPVVQTSRIRLAIASVQLFIQRCLLNLEPRVHPATINSEQWEWMKRYRVWEANRKIFLYPENWLEPEFRDDKTHLFSELEGTLLQGDVSGDLAEDAFLNYLRKLDELARLDICAMHIEDNSGSGERILHVFGRTFSQPHKYFYRRHAQQMWTPWEPVTAEIEGDHLAPVVWRDRLYLFWVTFTDKPGPDPNKNGDSRPLTQVPINELKKDLMAMPESKLVEVQLHWSEYMRGQWSTRKSGGFSSGISKIVSASFSPNSAFIHVSKEVDPDNGADLGVFINLGGDIHQTFYLAGGNGTPEPTIYCGRPYNPFSTEKPVANRYSGWGSVMVNFGKKSYKILSNGVSFTILAGNIASELRFQEPKKVMDPLMADVNLAFFPRFLADVTEKGLADIVYFNTEGVYVAFNKGDKSGFEEPEKVMGPLLADSQGLFDRPRFLADVTGKGLADIVYFNAEGVYVAFNKGDKSGFEEPKQVMRPFGNIFNEKGIIISQHFLANVTEKGSMDIVCFNSEAVFVSKRVEAYVKGRNINPSSKPVFYQDNQYTFFIEPEAAEKATAESNSWISTASPKLVWQVSEVPVVPQTSHGAPIPFPEDPKLFSSDPRSHITPSLVRDWLVNLDTVIKYDNALIGSNGQFGSEIQSVDDFTIRSKVMDGNTGSSLPEGSRNIVRDERSFASSGRNTAEGGLTIVGGAGFNSVLQKKLTAMNRSGSMKGACGTGVSDLR